MSRPAPEDRDALLRAYAATRYVVVDEGVEIAVEIGLPSPTLEALLIRHGAGIAAFITAWNPGSAVCPRAANDAAHAALLADLAAAGIAWLPHRGVGAEGHWEPEEGVLALGVQAAAAVAIATRHGQNAVVTVERGRPPRLVPTSLMAGVPSAEGVA